MSGKRKNGKARVVLLTTVLVILMLALMFYTILSATPSQLSLGVVSLDEGVSAYSEGGEGGSGKSGGGMNLGQQMLDNLTNGNFVTALASGPGAIQNNAYSIEFKSYDTQEDLNKAVETDEVVGAVVIPQDYTEKKVNETTNNVKKTTEDTTKKVVDLAVDSSQDPVVQDAIRNTAITALNAAGLDAGDGGNGAGDTKGSLKTMAPALFHVWLLIPPMAVGLLLAWVYRVRKGNEFASRVKRWGISLAMFAAASLVLAISLYWALAYAIDYGAEPIPSILYMWIVDFLVMTFFGGLAATNLGMAAIAASLFILLGAVTGFLSTDNVPDLLKPFVLPWIPETFTDMTLRKAVNASNGNWVNGMNDMWIYALIGIISGIAAAATGKSSYSDPY